MTTKQQERDALDKIEKILKGMDADGYLNTAFKGCVEDARRNIDEDAAYSAADRAARLQEKLDKIEAGNKQLREELATMQSRTLDKSDMVQAGNLAAKRLQYLRDSVKLWEETILEYCGAPQDIAFTDAVNRRKLALEEIDRLTVYRERLMHAISA